MRDLRADLKERIKDVDAKSVEVDQSFEAKIMALQKERDDQMDALRKEFNALQALLEIEDRRLGSASSAPKSSPTPPSQPLADFFERKLKEIGPMTKSQLRALAVEAGYFADDDRAGRAVHATLVNIVRAHRIDLMDDGQYAPHITKQRLLMNF